MFTIPQDFKKKKKEEEEKLVVKRPDKKFTSILYHFTVHFDIFTHLIEI